MLVTEIAADRLNFSWTFKINRRRQSEDVAVCLSLKYLRIQYRRNRSPEGVFITPVVMPAKIANLVESLLLFAFKPFAFFNGLEFSRVGMTLTTF